MKWIRGGLLGAAFVLSVASSQPQSREATTPAPQPQNLQGQQQTSAGKQPYFCYTLETPQTITSMCARDQATCETERQGALREGIETSGCEAWAPVACFQIKGDPAPEAELCAANLEDCEVWRAIDQQKNGTTGTSCNWKQ